MARSVWLYRLFARCPTRISFSGRVLRLEGAPGYGRLDIPFDTIDEIREARSIFWTRITICDLEGVERWVGGLRKGSATLLTAILRGEGARLAKQLSSRLLDMESELEKAFSGECYVRFAQGARLRERIRKLVALGRPAVVNLQLRPRAAARLKRFGELQSDYVFERARNAANKRYVHTVIPAVCDAMQTLLKMTPTDEQASAIATDEKTTLVLAGAGTGKTSVITGKVAHLIRNQGVVPKEILVLAFNRDAAKEVRERLSGELSGVKVSTFHAFGRQVIAQVSEAPTISKLATDEHAFQQEITRIIDSLVGDPMQEKKLIEFVAYNSRQYRSPFDFKSRSDYYNYVRNIDRRALSGDRVKSFEELEVANFLSLHGIHFEYERSYKAKTANSRHRQYQPDFYLPDYDIYIEHFALDENGDPPSDWPKYGEGVRWKRAIHQANHTRLVETYSWHCKQGILRKQLRRQLEECGVAFNPVPLREVIGDLRDRTFSWLARLIATFLRLVKTAAMNIDELRKRGAMLPGALRNETFVELFEQVWKRYETLLCEHGAIDFDDLINRATGLIGSSNWPSPYRWILVDEFQDISAGRIELLKALNRPDVSYFLVGDDWQSINRFAGSDVGLMKQCGKHLGDMAQCELTQTFRYGESIIRPSTAFIQCNPEQTKRSLSSAGKEDSDGITIVASKDPSSGIQKALTDISGLIPARESKSVLLLCRYNRSLSKLSRMPRRKVRVESSTVHRSKGREADYAVVIDLKDDLYGFPSKIEDDPLIDIVLNNSNPIPYAEERRLFYVAMTRARRGVYLVTDSVDPSAFINELRGGEWDLRQVADFARDTAPRCPLCRGGSLVVSQSAKNLRCTNHPLCGYLVPRCESCEEGYILRSNGSASCSDCGAVGQICPDCSIGLLQRREGSSGPFWGCTEYFSEPPCAYTKDASE